MHSFASRHTRLDASTTLAAQTNVGTFCIKEDGHEINVGKAKAIEFASTAMSNEEEAAGFRIRLQKIKAFTQEQYTMFVSVVEPSNTALVNGGKKEKKNDGLNGSQ